MTTGIVISTYGDAKQLVPTAISVGAPGEGQVRLRHTGVAVNFHDVYVRSGLYKTLSLPGIPGVEASAVIESVGPGVTGFRVGDRVGYVDNTYGAYADARLIAANKLIKVPAEISDDVVASSLMKGLTTWMLLGKLRPVKSGDTILVHSAAGGVGQLLSQWANHIGATVIGTVSTKAKAEIVLKRGCHHAIVRGEEDFVARVADITKGRGVEVAYDSIGKDTLDGSIQTLAMRGHLINFGQASGPVTDFVPSKLAAKSNALWRPIVFHYLVDPKERQEMADQLFSTVASGALTIEKATEFPLAQAAAAHELLESGKSTGAIILRP